MKKSRSRSREKEVYSDRYSKHDSRGAKYRRRDPSPNSRADHISYNHTSHHRERSSSYRRVEDREREDRTYDGCHHRSWNGVEHHRRGEKERGGREVSERRDGRGERYKDNRTHGRNYSEYNKNRYQSHDNNSRNVQNTEPRLYANTSKEHSKNVRGGVNGGLLNDMRSPAPRILSLDALTLLNENNKKADKLDIDSLLNSNLINANGQSPKEYSEGGVVSSNPRRASLHREMEGQGEHVMHTYGNEYGLQEENVLNHDGNEIEGSDICNHLSYQLKKLGHSEPRTKTEPTNQNTSQSHRDGQPLDQNVHEDDVNIYRNGVETEYGETRSETSQQEFESSHAFPNDIHSNTNSNQSLSLLKSTSRSIRLTSTTSVDVMSMNGSICGWSVTGSVGTGGGSIASLNSVPPSPILLQHCSSSDWYEKNSCPGSPCSASSSVSAFSGRVHVV